MTARGAGAGGRAAAACGRREQGRPSLAACNRREQPPHATAVSSPPRSPRPQGIFHPSPLGSCLTALGMLHGAFNFGVFWSNHSAVSQTWRDCLHLLRPSRPSDVSLFEPLTAAWDKESMASSGSTSPVSALMADAPRSWRTPAGLVLLPPARAP